MVGDDDVMYYIGYSFETTDIYKLQDVELCQYYKEENNCDEGLTSQYQLHASKCYRHILFYFKTYNRHPSLFIVHVKLPSKNILTII